MASIRSFVSSIAWHELQTLTIGILIVGIIELFSRVVFPVPLKEVLLLAVIIFSVFSSGIRPGLFVLIIASLYLSYLMFFPTGRFVFSQVYTINFTIFLLSSLVSILFTGILKRREVKWIIEKNTRLEAEKASEKLRRLHWISDAALSYGTIDELLNEMLERVKKLLCADIAAVLLLDEEEQVLRPKATKGFTDETENMPKIPVGEGFVGKIAKEKKASIEFQINKHDLFSPKLQSMRIKSMLGVPLMVGERVVGVWEVGTFKKRVFTEEDVQLLQLGADRAAMAIDHAYQYSQAQEAIQARDEFLSIASHELKTPLTSMLLQLQAILRSVQNQSLATFSVEKMVKMLESAEKQSNRLSKLIKDLLNVSLVSSGRLELEKEEVDLHEVVKEMATHFEKQLEIAGCELQVFADESVKGAFDKVRIEQVVSNLFSNAIKYGNGKPIEVTLQQNDQQAILSVKDQGIGISKNQQGIIFKRFKRAVSNTQYKGLGIGLYITQQIIAAHGGQIAVKSIEGEGSMFIVTLPLHTS